MACGGCCNSHMGLQPPNTPLPFQPYDVPRPVPTHYVENGRLVRRGGFVERQKRRLATVARDPRCIKFRELVGLLFLSWMLWQLAPLVSEGYQLMSLNADNLCRKTSYFRCMRVHTHIFWWKLKEWIGQWIVWLPVVVLVTFVAEVGGIDRLY